MRLPVTLIIPTRNCIQKLKDHIVKINEVIDSVGEIICVDGNSTDGTADLLKEYCLKIGNRAKFISLAPGLYEGWNEAIKNSRQDWIYFSTVGDVICKDGLDKLYRIAIQQNVDLVITPPRMYRSSKNNINNHLRKWPIHFFSERMVPGEVIKLKREETVLAMCSFLPSSLLGSCASNLFRGDFLRKNLFPIEYGHAGDTAWGIRNCLNIEIAILNEEITIFDIHWEMKEKDARLQRELFQKLVELGKMTLENFFCSNKFYIAWFEALSENKMILWNWLASQADLAQKYEEILKYNQKMREELERRIPERIYRFILKILRINDK